MAARFYFLRLPIITLSLLAAVSISAIILSGCGEAETGSAAATTPTGKYASCLNLAAEKVEQKKQESRDQIKQYSSAIANFVPEGKVEIFIVTSAGQAEIDALGEQIKGMNEVKSVEFVSKEQAYEKLRQSLGESPHTDAVLGSLTGNPLPASYILTLNDPGQEETVAKRLFDNPLADNAPGTHDGVKYSSQGQEKMKNEIGLLQDYIDNAHSCQAAA
jgi:hypothetical protein